ncbi:MAG: hypothetical protein R2750_08115 [Bacteroidales bacterium]
MKAFKQINFHSETRFFWSYGFALCTLTIFIIISPALAQTGPIDEDAPEIRVDVKKEYDEEGNVIRIDSSRMWCWLGKEFSIEQQDSIVNEIEKNVTNILHRNHRLPLGTSDLPFGPPLHRFWHWNGADSTVTSLFDKFKGERFYGFFNLRSKPNLFWNSPFHDSIDFADKYINPKLIDDYFEKNLNEMEDFCDRFRRYQKEYQELFEKILSQPGQNEDIDPHDEQNPDFPSSRHEGDKTVNI